MTSKKLFYSLVALIIVLGLGLLFSAYEANKMLANKSSKLASLKADKKAVTKQQAQLKKDKRDITKYHQLNQIAKSVVPQDKNQAEAVREIVALAKQSGIGKLSSITFPSSSLGGNHIKSPSGALTQVMPVKGIGGVYKLQITIKQSSHSPVPYAAFTKFLKKLEHNRRTAEVSSISIQPDKKKPNMVSFTLVINEFIHP
jgi:hypothetical protein